MVAKFDYGWDGLANSSSSKVEGQFKKGDKVKSTYSGNKGEVGEVMDVKKVRWTLMPVYIIRGFTDGSPSTHWKGCYEYTENFLELYTEPEQVEFEEPEEDEFTSNCTHECKPGDHKCKN